MNAVMSSIGGVCVFEKKNVNRYYSIISTSEVYACDILHKFSLLNDWQDIEGNDEKEILQKAKELHAIESCILDIESCLSGALSDDLVAEVISDIDNALKSISTSQILSLLLRASIRSVENLQNIIKIALSHGYVTTGNLLKKVNDYQKILQQFLDKWIEVSLQIETQLSIKPIEILNGLAEARCIEPIILADKKNVFQSAWYNYLLKVEGRHKKSTIVLMQKLSEKLFPNDLELSEELLQSNLQFDKKFGSHHKEISKNNNKNVNKSHLFVNIKDKVLRQVNAISDAVAKGFDANAEKYLDQLVKEQVALNKNAKFVTMSLCNIATNCAQLFRVDFEYKCLLIAKSLNPDDSWAKVQLAEHFKNSGKFSEAIKLFSEVISKKEYGETHQIALTSLADVYVHQKRYDLALDYYNNFLKEGNCHFETVELAIADLYRKKGDFSIAINLYKKYEEKFGPSHRAKAGIAEIDKFQGNFSKARNTYISIIKEIKDYDDKSYFVYSLALANIYRREKNLDEAFKIFNELAELRPYSKSVLCLRNSVALLLGEENKISFPKDLMTEAKAFGEWKQNYFIGLHLLKLRQFEKAKEALLQNIKKEFRDEDADISLRLGVAAYYLHDTDGVVNAENELKGIVCVRDLQHQYILKVLKYQIAKIKKDNEELSRLAIEISKIADKGMILPIKNSIDEEDWKTVNNLVVSALLMLFS